MVEGGAHTTGSMVPVAGFGDYLQANGNWWKSLIWICLKQDPPAPVTAKSSR